MKELGRLRQVVVRDRPGTLFLDLVSSIPRLSLLRYLPFCLLSLFVSPTSLIFIRTLLSRAPRRLAPLHSLIPLSFEDTRLCICTVHAHPAFHLLVTSHFGWWCILLSQQNRIGSFCIIDRELERPTYKDGEGPTRVRADVWELGKQHRLPKSSFVRLS